MRCSKHSLQADKLVDDGNISEKSVDDRTSWLWKTGTVERICVIQVLNSTLHRSTAAVFT